MTRRLKVLLLIVALPVALLSAVSWFRLHTYETRCFVSVQLNNIPAGLTVIGDWTKIIEIKIKGSKSKVNSVAGNHHLTYMLDLSGVKQRVNIINVENDRFSLPKGITITEIMPSFITLKVEEEINKNLPVDLMYSGKPAAGYFIADAVVTPSEIILQGPKSVMESLYQVKTKPVDVTDAQETIKMETMLDLPENVRPAFPEKHMISAIFIEESVVVKKISDIPVEGKDAMWEYSITPATLSLELKGHEKDLEKLSGKGDEGGVRAFVDLKKLNPGVYVRHATIYLPGNVTLINVEPMVFTVKLAKKKEHE